MRRLLSYALSLSEYLLSSYCINFYDICHLCVHCFLYSVSCMYDLHPCSPLSFSPYISYPYFCRYWIKYFFSIHTLCWCLCVASLFYNCVDSSAVDISKVFTAHTYFSLSSLLCSLKHTDSTHTNTQSRAHLPVYR